jgi:hypothetical protein
MTPQEYNQLITLAQGSATWRHYVTNLINNAEVVNISNFGDFHSTITQASGGITAKNLVQLNGISTANGLSVQNNAVIPSNSGTYLINTLGQFRFSGGGSGGNITFWYEVNDVAPDDSSFTFFLPTSNNFQLLSNVEAVLQLNAGDRIKFYWWSDINPAANVALHYTPAGTNPTRPASPSVNVSILQLS